MARERSKTKETMAVPMTRGLILYVWLIVMFGCVLLIAHTSIQEKEIRLQIGSRYKEKKELIDEIERLDVEIQKLESYSRIAKLVEERIPALGHPQYMAIELRVPGLREADGYPSSDSLILEDRSMMGRFRRSWGSLEESVNHWLQAWVEKSQ